MILPRHHLKRSICKVHCLDRLPKPDAEFAAVSERHASRYGGSISYATHTGSVLLQPNLSM